MGLFFVSFVIAATPVGPDNTALVSNETKGVNEGVSINISGGRIGTYNLTATIQNPRWKGFVGNVSGSFTLDDAGGSTLFDWSITTITGYVYTTRNYSTPPWSDLWCANGTTLENENDLMSHTSSEDNITATFDDANHSQFIVAGVSIPADTCNFTLNTYNGTAAQISQFDEIALIDNQTDYVAGEGVAVVYATKIENDVIGFDNATYDFQMIVPENGSAIFSGTTPYYLYVELT